MCWCSLPLPKILPDYKPPTLDNLTRGRSVDGVGTKTNIYFNARCLGAQPLTRDRNLRIEHKLNVEGLQKTFLADSGVGPMRRALLDPEAREKLIGFSVHDVVGRTSHKVSRRI